MHRWRQANVLALALLLMAAVRAGPAPAGELNADGLYEEPWFLQSFLELDEDWRSAGAAGKHFAIIWELKGCAACARLHRELLGRADIGDYMRRHFDLLQLNFIGARPVVDFDGHELAEKALAKRHGIEGTPSIQLFARQAAAGEPPREVLRIRSVPGEQRFLAMLRYVESGRYTRESFDEYWRATCGSDVSRECGVPAVRDSRRSHSTAARNS